MAPDPNVAGVRGRPNAPCPSRVEVGDRWFECEAKGEHTEHFVAGHVHHAIGPMEVGRFVDARITWKVKLDG